MQKNFFKGHLKLSLSSQGGCSLNGARGSLYNSAQPCQPTLTPDAASDASVDTRYGSLISLLQAPPPGGPSATGLS